MKSKLFLLLLSIVTSYAYAQQNDRPSSTVLDKLLKVEAGLHGLGVGYELPLSSKWTVDLSTGLGGGYYIENTTGTNFQSSFILNEPVAFFKSEFKNYYNRDKRLSKSKSIRNNAGNYVAFQTKYTTERALGGNDWDKFFNPLNNTLLNEVHWGLQRPLGQKFLFNLHLGLGYAYDFDFENGSVYPAIGAKFSYVLSKKGM